MLDNNDNIFIVIRIFLYINLSVKLVLFIYVKLASLIFFQEEKRNIL